MDKKSLIRHLKERGFPENIISGFEKTDREKFVPLEHKQYSYEDLPLPIGHGQTISQPYTIAFMLTLLEISKNQKILEVGSGSGYVLEIMRHISPRSQIFGIERIKNLAEDSREKLSVFKNIKVIHEQGEKGLEKEAPFDRILVSAASKNIPQNLLNQLKFKGVLVAPVGNSIIKIKKESGENKIEEFPGFVFVPLVEAEK